MLQLSPRHLQILDQICQRYSLSTREQALFFCIQQHEVTARFMIEAMIDKVFQQVSQTDSRTLGIQVSESINVSEQIR